MKRLLRIVILAPIFVIAGAAFFLVLPIVFFIWWLYDNDLAELWEIVKEIVADGASEVWMGEHA